MTSSTAVAGEIAVEHKMEQVEREFMWAVQALAQPADVQPELFPDFVVVADELALEFDAARLVAESQVGRAWSARQHQAVAYLDARLSEMGARPELWSNEGCLDHPRWSEVRQLAREVLAVFGWSPARPPLGRVVYVRGGPR
jgi:hypothetical protein